MQDEAESAPWSQYQGTDQLPACAAAISRYTWCRLGITRSLAALRDPSSPPGWPPLVLLRYQE